jgi:hypothetical protein
MQHRASALFEVKLQIRAEPAYSGLQRDLEPDSLAQWNTALECVPFLTACSYKNKHLRAYEEHGSISLQSAVNNRWGSCVISKYTRHLSGE